MTEDIFDTTNVKTFKEIEKKNVGDVYILLCLRSAELSKAFGLRKLCYSKISAVKTRARAKQICPVLNAAFF